MFPSWQDFEQVLSKMGCVFYDAENFVVAAVGVDVILWRLVPTSPHTAKSSDLQQSSWDSILFHSMFY